MPIPESQLETWAHQGATVTAKATHEAVRRALAADSSPIKGKEYEVYLQGSYKNDTNIRGDSDVDVVVQLNSTFSPDLSRLDAGKVQAFHQVYPTPATYLWSHFRADVLGALQAHFGSGSVQEGNKSLKIVAAGGRLPTDVIPSLQHRTYYDFQSLLNQQYIEGIVFYTLRENRQVINYPKVHYENGVKKNSDKQTNGWFKPTVRVFKNARSYLIDHHVIDGKLAPSYFVESYIYNAPNGLFGGSYGETFAKVLNWLAQPSGQLTCQNGVVPLFGTSPEQWSQDRAQQLVRALVGLWNTR